MPNDKQDVDDIEIPSEPNSASGIQAATTLTHDAVPKTVEDNVDLFKSA